MGHTQPLAIYYPFAGREVLRSVKNGGNTPAAQALRMKPRIPPGMAFLGGFRYNQGQGLVSGSMMMLDVG